MAPLAGTLVTSFLETSRFVAVSNLWCPTPLGSGDEGITRGLARPLVSRLLLSLWRGELGRPRLGQRCWGRGLVGSRVAFMWGLGPKRGSAPALRSPALAEHLLPASAAACELSAPRLMEGTGQKSLLRAEHYYSRCLHFQRHLSGHKNFLWG